jgi:DNA-binding transcriptional ArsR family regulator
MTPANPFGDIELTDPQSMRALAHPVRLAIMSRLQRFGPATASELSPQVGATPSVTSWHLRHLAGFGLVRDAAPGTDRRERRWEAAGRGYRFAVPPGDENSEDVTAARLLSQLIFAQNAVVPQEWSANVEPTLTGPWRQVAGVSNTRVVVTAEEAEVINEAIEALLAPFVVREPADRPHGSRGVRMLRYLLPDADPVANDADPTAKADGANPDSTGRA